MEKIENENKKTDYDENVSLLDYGNPRFKFNSQYQWLREQAEGHRRRRNQCLSALVSDVLCLDVFALPKNHLGGVWAEHRFYAAFKQAVKDADRRYAQYVRDQKAKGVVFLDSSETEFW